MIVQELIKALEAYPPDMPVAYRMYSEQTLLEANQLDVVELCLPRADGWIQNKRPDMPSQKYLMFPGN